MQSFEIHFLIVVRNWNCVYRKFKNSNWLEIKNVMSIRLEP